MSTDHQPFTFDADTLSRCDQIAFECLGDVVRKRLLPKYQSALYENKTFGDYLLVCADGTILFAPAEIGASLLVAGFKNGLRSNLDAVKRSSEKAALQLAGK